MLGRSLPIAVLLLISVLSVVQHVYYWTQLPEQVATHFGADGVANDWMPRTAATLTLASLQLGVPWFLVAMTWLASRLPNSLYNIPNRQYWLHPDRRQATIQWMSVSMQWIAVLSAILMVGIGHLTFQANIHQQSLHLGAFGVLLIGYLAIILGFAAVSLKRFRMPESADPSLHQ